MTQAISFGYVDEGLLKRQPGKMVHSRWLTTANRILRLYVSSKNPSTNLCIITEFVMRVYAPIWIKIKQKPSCIIGPKHLLNMIKMSRYMSNNELKIIDPVIQRNAYFGHPENVLLTMLFDKRPYSDLALRMIISARELYPIIQIRTFKIPKLNFSADDYVDLIDWTNVEVTEPPLIRDLTMDDLQKLVNSDNDEIVSIIRNKICK